MTMSQKDERELFDRVARIEQMLKDRLPRPLTCDVHAERLNQIEARQRNTVAWLWSLAVALAGSVASAFVTWVRAKS